MRRLNRRGFLKAAFAASAAGVAPLNILAGGPSPNSKLNLVGVGIGRMGSNNLRQLRGHHNIIGIADPDEAWNGRHYPDPKVKRWRDYRKMFDEIGKKIDGVVTATPEHARFAVCMYCIRRGKHVFAQKPLVHTVNEARVLLEESRKNKVVTQMGNQGHSAESTARIRDWIKAGAIGNVTEVIGYSRKNYWTRVKPVEGCTVPKTLDWDLWLNRAEEIPFSTSYMNREWIRYSHFSGVVGDMATHILDPANYSLELGPPISVEAEVQEKHRGFPGSLPVAGVITWKFPARGDKPPVTMKYYVGPEIDYPRPKRLEEGRAAPFMGSGSVMIGDKASMYAGSHSQGPGIFPEAVMKETPKPPRVSERNKGRGHEGNWTHAITNGGTAMSNFEYACPFTETLVLGDVALLNPGRKLLWDSKNLKITNDEKANKDMFTRRIKPRDEMGWM